MAVFVRQEPFNPWDEIVGHEARTPALAGKFGATAVFVGSLRDFNDGRQVSEMTLEHYPGMTAKYLERIREEAHAQWDVLDSLVIHRYGDLNPNDPIVLVAVWSAHRAPAFDACRYIIDKLKTQAPFWKREVTERGPEWVRPVE
jgi:molybdopterin synthase catalytic subunit